MHKLIRGEVEVLREVHTTPSGTEGSNDEHVVCTDAAVAVMIVLEVDGRGWILTARGNIKRMRMEKREPGSK